VRLAAVLEQHQGSQPHRRVEIQEPKAPVFGNFGKVFDQLIEVLSPKQGLFRPDLPPKCTCPATQTPWWAAGRHRPFHQLVEISRMRLRALSSIQQLHRDGRRDTLGTECRSYEWAQNAPHKTPVTQWPLCVWCSCMAAGASTACLLHAVRHSMLPCCRHMPASWHDGCATFKVWSPLMCPAGMQVRGDMSIRRLDSIIAEDIQVV
jgi:hypothetical protein